MSDALFDRDAARGVLRKASGDPFGGHRFDEMLDALAGCVRPVPPQVIDRETVASAIQAGRYMGRMFPAGNPRDFEDADRILALITSASSQTIDRNELITYFRSGVLHDWAGGGFDSEDLADGVLALVVPDSRFATIRALHVQGTDWNGAFLGWCEECQHVGDVWPCATVRALDGEAG